MELQNKIKEKWEHCSTGYSQIIKDELNSFRPQAWIDLIKEQVEFCKTLKILDIGCGPGFFSIILSKCGHDVMGIDCCDNMIKEAEFNAMNEGVTPKFSQMDSHKLEFEDDTFDLILNRNVTWTLADPIRAYAEWKRVLKPGGKLLIFDANWKLEKYDNDLRKENEKREQACIEKYGSTFGDTSDKTVEEPKNLFLDDKLRPTWDEIALTQIGFKNLIIDKNIINRVWDDKEKLLYGATPMFMICGEKTLNDEPKAFNEINKSIKEYWTKRSASYSEQNNEELNSNKKNIWKEMILENIEEKGKLKILDVGCGPGEFSILMAKEGHDVVGVDLTEAMLEEARNNALKYNVSPKFINMDIQNLEFQDETFDLIISRNVTWHLQDVDKFFNECNRVLKNNGKLIYFDANWYLYLYDEKIRQEKEVFDKENIDIYKKHEKNYSKVSLTNVAYNLPMSKVNRPDWDSKNLHRYKFEVTRIDRNINNRIYDEKTSYDSAQMFTVVAKKVNNIAM